MSERGAGITDFLATLICHCRGKVRGIQRTLWSRRKSQSTTGAKRIQAGRPSNSETPSNKRRTKKRCLGKNMQNYINIYIYIYLNIGTRYNKQTLFIFIIVHIL